LDPDATSLYILTGIFSNDSSICMNCKFEWSDAFVVVSVNKTYFHTELREQKKQKCFEIEKSKLAESQMEAKHFLVREHATNEIKRIDLEMKALKKKIEELKRSFDLAEPQFKDHYKMTALFLLMGADFTPNSDQWFLFDGIEKFKYLLGNSSQFLSLDQQNYLLEQISLLNVFYKDLVEGSTNEKDTSFKSSEYGLSNNYEQLLNDFLNKAQEILIINNSKYDTRKELYNVLNTAYDNEPQIFEKKSKRYIIFEQQYNILSDIYDKCNKFLYSILIFKDLVKYVNTFKYPSSNEYNISYLYDILIYNSLIPNLDNIDKDFSNIGSDIYEFISIKRTEYVFKNILSKRFEGINEIGKDKKIISDLESIISESQKYPNLQYLPWCNPQSKDKFNICSSTQQFLQNIDNYNLNNSFIQNIKVKSDNIIKKISENNLDLDTELQDLKELYKSSFEGKYIDNENEENLSGDNISSVENSTTNVMDKQNVDKLKTTKGGYLKKTMRNSNQKTNSRKTMRLQV
jgi:hypothetical protein